jgi:hypothetical protein
MIKIPQLNSKMKEMSIRIFLGKYITMISNRVSKILRTNKKGKVENKKKIKKMKEMKRKDRVIIRMKIKAKSLRRKFQVK